MWKTILGLGGKALGAVGLLGAGAAADATFNGGGITEFFSKTIPRALGLGQNEAKSDVAFDWIGQLVEMVSKLIKSVAGESGLTRALDGWAGRITGEPVSPLPGGLPGQGGPGSANGNNPGGPQGVLDSDPDTLGLSLGQTAGVAGIAAVGATALGTRAIPVVGGVVAGVDTIADVATLSLQGHWKAAGVRTLSGIADTVGSSFGFLGMAFGAAGREAIEAGGEKMLGQDAHLGDGEMVSLAKTGARLVLGR